MLYEISKEMFKQRLEDRLNFVLIDLNPLKVDGDKDLKDTVKMAYDDNFAQSFQSQYSDKKQNVLLYSLQDGDRSPEKAAEQLKNQGYHFVYYYCGKPDDIILDKGLN